MDHPAVLDALKREAEQLNFTLSCDDATGQVLRLLAASKPHGLLLEIGTGIGQGTAWLLDGLPLTSRLVSLDHNAETQAVAKRYLGQDLRLTFHQQDASSFLEDMAQQRFDLIFADARPGKYEALDQAVALLNEGGLYIVDDMQPTPGLRPALRKARETRTPASGRLTSSWDPGWQSPSKKPPQQRDAGAPGGVTKAPGFRSSRREEDTLLQRASGTP